MDEFDIDP